MQRRKSRSPKTPQSASVRMKGTSSNRNLFTENTRRRLPLVWILLIVLLVVGVLGAYNLIQGSIVRVDELTVVIPGLDRAFEGYTILHISDLHGARFGQSQQQLLSAIRRHSYNAVCITGDVVSASNDPYAFYELLEGLGTRQPVYFIAGDEDPVAVISEAHQSNEVLADFVLGGQRRGATFVDSPISISYGGQTIWFAPESLFSLDIDSAQQSYRDQLQSDLNGGNAELESVKARIRALRYRINTLDRAKAAREIITEEDLVIALTHSPLQSAFVSTMQGWTVTGTGISFAQTMDLVLAGHYNGGQIRLPLLGALYIPNQNLPRNGWFPDQSLVQGLMQTGGVLQHVSSGLGVAQIYGLHFRLFNPPRVTVLRLTGSFSR